MAWTDRVEIEIPGQRKIINGELRHYPHIREHIDPANYVTTEAPSATVHMTLAQWTEIVRVMDLYYTHHNTPWVEEARQRYMAALALVNRNC